MTEVVLETNLPWQIAVTVSSDTCLSNLSEGKGTTGSADIGTSCCGVKQRQPGMSPGSSIGAALIAELRSKRKAEEELPRLSRYAGELLSP
jgi:hypothetical protein